MIPVIVPAGIIMGIGIMIGQFIGVDANSAKLLTSSDPILKFIGWIEQVAGAGMMGLMFPVFAAFVSYSICDKPGLAPGFIGGYLAKEMGSGFLGAIAIGIFAGYIVSLILTISGVISLIDLTAFKEMNLFKIPQLTFMNWNFSEFNWNMIGKVILLFVPVSLASAMEHCSDHKVLSNINGTD